MQIEVMETTSAQVTAKNQDDKAIGTFEQFEQAITAVKTVDDAKLLVDNMAKLEKLLKAADMWHEKAREYLTMEAEAYCRIAELGLGEGIPHHSAKYKTVKWLEGMDADERRAYVNECTDECASIMEMYKRAVVEPEGRIDAYSQLHYYRDEVLEKFKSEESVVLEEYDFILDRARKYLPSDVVKCFKDDVRNKLRQAGAHGLGDDRGTYATASSAKASISEMVANKVRRIKADVERLKQIIAEEGGCYEPRLAIATRSNLTHDLTDESVANIALLLSGIGTAEYGERSELSRAKLIASILGRLGYTPVQLVEELYRNSIQYCEANGFDESVARVDMREYGMAEDAA